MKGLTKEIDQEIARNKPASLIRLIWQGVKAMFRELKAENKALRKELNQLREFVNSPDDEHRAA